MATTTPRARKIAKITSVVVGVGLGAVATLGFTNAAFVATTDPNAGNNIATAGAVTLTEQFTTPLFSFGTPDAAGNLQDPPRSGNTTLAFDGNLTPQGLTPRSIDIVYQGDAAADVRMFVSNMGTVSPAGANLKDTTLVTVTRTVDGVTETVYSDKPLSQLPTSWETAIADTADWDVSHGTHVATYTFTIRAGADPAATPAATLRGVEFTWSAQHQ